MELANITADANPWRRLTAQRLLVKRNANDVSKILSARIRNGGPYQGCIHALYTLSRLGQLAVSDIEHATRHKHYGVRVHALRLSEDRLSGKLLDSVIGMIDDADPTVRLQVAMTLGESHHSKVVETLVDLARRHGSERWMAAAIASSSVKYGAQVLGRLLDDPGNLGEGVALLRAIVGNYRWAT